MHFLLKDSKLTLGENMEIKIRKFKGEDIDVVMEIINLCKVDLKNRGVDQWQKGYPNLETLADDLVANHGYVIQQETIIGYFVLQTSPDEFYENIDGKWLSDGEYSTIHRIALLPNLNNQGIGTKVFKLIEAISIENKRNYIRVDTGLDNLSMQRVLSKNNYIDCGLVEVTDGLRKAYEKQLLD